MSEPDSVAANRQLVQSSVIRSIGYDALTSSLVIEFRKSRTYRYFDVPEFLYRGFLLARSKGEYFSTRINNRFEFEEVLADDVR